MFGVSLQPSASVHPSVARGMCSSHVVMESPAAPRQSERLERLERTIENELVPRLLASHRAGPIPPALSMAIARELSASDVDSFVAAIRSPDDVRAAEFIREVLAEGATIEAVYLDLLAPIRTSAWRDVGRG